MSANRIIQSFYVYTGVTSKVDTNQLHRSHYLRPILQQSALFRAFPFNLSPVSIQTHATQRCMRCVKNRIDSIVAFSCARILLLCTFAFACVIFLRFLHTFYFACVLLLTQGLACVWMETGLYALRLLEKVVSHFIPLCLIKLFNV